MINEVDAIDLKLRGGRLVRAKLHKGCSSTDFYSGFYIKRTRDGRLCQDRDTIHSRAGGDCAIRRFRLLTPVTPERRK